MIRINVWINLLIIIIVHGWLTKPQLPSSPPPPHPPTQKKKKKKKTELPSVLHLEGENQAKESEAQNLVDFLFSYKFGCQNQQVIPKLEDFLGDS